MKQKDKPIISIGNKKLKGIPNVSWTPIDGCLPGVPCIKDCYALKAYRLHPSVRKAWDHNLDLVRRNAPLFFQGANSWLQHHQPKLFRFFVAGDLGAGNELDSWEHLKLVFDVCKDNPKTKFLLFTKCHFLNTADRPTNLTIVFSMWNNYGINHPGRLKAWYLNPKDPDPRIPDEAIPCAGHCDRCGICWHLKKLKKDVVFTKH